jgi:hypothetical protein
MYFHSIICGKVETWQVNRQVLKLRSVAIWYPAVRQSFYHSFSLPSSPGYNTYNIPLFIVILC